jgi:hypothetical protein
MAKEDLLARTFVELADTLVDHYDVIDFLQRLAERCVELLGVEEAGILLADEHGKPRVVASSSERMRLVELFEVQAEDGPCLDCFQSGEPVRAADLEAARDRWPQFGPSAIEAGMRSVYALPMRLRDDRVGALNLFSDESGGLIPSEEVMGQALADVATIGILQERFLHERQVLADQLQTALDTRVVLEQAKGIVAEQSKLDLDDAFALLRGHARAQNLPLGEVARAAIEGRLHAEGLRRRPSGRP